MSEFFTVEGRTLAIAMKAASAIVEKWNRIPILSFVKLTCGGSVIHLQTTDLDIELRSSIDAIDASGEFSICLPAAALHNIAKMAGVAPVRIGKDTRVVKRCDRDKNLIEHEKHFAKLTIDNGAAIYELDTLPAEDFPDIAGDRGDIIERFSNGSLAAMMKKVAWAVSKEETRYYLNGVAWQSGEKGRRFVASDGHRLALCQYQKDATESWSRIIPNKTISFILRHLANADATICATNRDLVIDVITPDLTIRTKLIDGRYPDIDRVVPAPAENMITMATGHLIAAVSQTMAIGGETWRCVKLASENGNLTVTRQNPDFGAACIKTNVAWPANLNPVGFNGKYLVDVLKSCAGNICFNIKDHQSPAIITDEDGMMTRIIMPMRVA